MKDIAMTTSSGTEIRDTHALPMFDCSRCGEAMTQEEFFALGMRLPDTGESRGDYYDAELIDSVTHLACLESARPS